MSKVPDELRYVDSHEWVRVSGPTATIGITDFAQDQLTDVVFVELPKVGAVLQQGKTFGVVESVKSVSDLYAPVSGTVAEVNVALQKAPEKINDDPYGDGWLLKVRLANPGDVASLLDAGAYRKLIGE